MFIGPDTCCFVMDPTRAGQVLARHAGIDEKTGQLTAGEDGGPRRLVISSDFCTVYESAGKKADGLVNLYCWAHIRRYFVRAGDAYPAQLKYWTQAWLDRIRDLYRAHDQLTAAWQEAAAPAPQREAVAAARLEEAGRAWDGALAVIDETRKKQAQAPGLAEPAKKALATLDREWDGLAAHRSYPLVSLDNYPDVAVMPMLLVPGGFRCWSGRCSRRVVRHSLRGFRGRRGACPGACSGPGGCAAGLSGRGPAA